MSSLESPRFIYLFILILIFDVFVIIQIINELLKPNR